MNEIVKHIDELIKKKGLTKKALANKMHFPPTTLNNWFYDDVFPSLDSLEAVCTALEISVEQFFGSLCKEHENKAEEEFLSKWRLLSPTEKSAVEKVIAAFKETK